MPGISGDSSSPKSRSKQRPGILRFFKKGSGELRRSSLEEQRSGSAQKTTGRKVRPLSMSFLEQFVPRKPSQQTSSTATSCSRRETTPTGRSGGSCPSCCKCKKVCKKKGGTDPKEVCRGGSCCVCKCDEATTFDLLGRFVDEDDLYSEMDKTRCGNHDEKEDLEYEDAGVCLASVSSSSPATSQRGNRDNKAVIVPQSVPRSQRYRNASPASDVTATESFNAPTTSSSKSFDLIHCGNGFPRMPKRNGPPSSTCSSTSLLPGPDETCPNCGSPYDRASKRKLVDSECGHGKCYECMFQTSGCRVCQGGGSAFFHLSQRRRRHAHAFASVHGRMGGSPRRGGGRLAEDRRVKARSSVFSRESGFHSGCASACSSTRACDDDLPSFSPATMTYDADDCELDDRDEIGSVVSSPNGSVVSLMSSCHSANSRNFSHLSNFVVPANTLRKNDFKRHSLSSLRKFQPGWANLSQRNSYSRRSAILPRYNHRMSSIEEHAPPVESGDWPLTPLFFEVPTTSSSDNRSSFVGRKWLFRELLENLSSDLPTSGGIVIHGRSATGKTSVILNMVQSSCFGHKAPSMSTTMDILAREVIAYHFCQSDNEETCNVPQFVRSVAAQMSQSPVLASYRKLVASDGRLRRLLSVESCTADSSAAFIRGVLEPLIVLRSQGKITNQRCLILIDGLCEAERHRNDNGDTLSSFLASHLSQLPRWMRIVCTVRSDMMDVIRPFPFHRISLDNAHVDERIHKDITDFVERRIRESRSIQRNVVPQQTKSAGPDGKSPQSRMANFVVRSANGCFLYAEKLLDLFHAGKLQVKSSSFSFVPVSLSEIYLLEFNLLFATSEQFAKIKDVLSVCLASLRPLTPRDVFGCVNALRDGDDDVSWDEFIVRFDALSRFLPARADGTLMFCHSTLRDWLMGRRTVDSTKFVVDPRRGHAAIALDLTRNRSPLGPEQTLRLGHHLLKAKPFRRCDDDADVSVRDLQAAWMATASHSTTDALTCPTNLYSPNVKVSRLLLLSGASPNAVVDAATGETLMNAFAALNNVEMVKLLLEFGGDVDVPNIQGATALMTAAFRGNAEVVRQLVVVGGAGVNVTDSQGSTALAYAVKGGHHVIVSTLLSLPWPEVGCRLRDAAQEAFVVACRTGSLTLVQMLLDCCAADVVRPCGLSGETGLCAAAKAGRFKTCELLVRHGADVATTNRKSVNPVGLAVSEGHYCVVEMLLNTKPELVSASCDGLGRSPLCVAASEGQVGVIELLISRGAGLEWRNRSDGLTPLGWAVLGAKHNAVDLLLKSGASMDAKDGRRRSAFHQAAVIGNVATLQALLNHCCAPDVVAKHIEETDEDGMRPIDRAIAHGHRDVVVRLLKRGAKLGPTTWAVAKGKPDIGLVLLNKLLEDGNTLFRRGRLDEAAYRYEYALKRLPRIRESTSPNGNCGFVKESDQDFFTKLKLHLLLNLSRTRRKQKMFDVAIEKASEVLAFQPNSFEALWARGKAKSEVRSQQRLESALVDLREAIALAPQNLELHKFTICVKEEWERNQQKTQSSNGGNLVQTGDVINQDEPEQQ